MGARALIPIGATLVALAVAAGALAPLAHPIAQAALGALTIALALHGLGRLAGRLLGDDDAPAALAIAWGLAVYLALGGWLAALGWFDRAAQLAVALAGVALGAIWIARRGDLLVAAARRWRPELDTAVVAGAAILVALHLLGAAGARHGGFGDGDGDLLGPLARLAQTGALPDAIGAPRTGGLGGSAIATSLGWVFDDWRASHAVDGGLGLALAIALLFGLRGPGPARPYVGFAVAALALGVPALPPGLAPRWITVALVLATYATLRRGHARPLALLVAAGAATLGHGGLGLVAAVILARAGGTAGPASPGHRTAAPASRGHRTAAPATAARATRPRRARRLVHLRGRGPGLVIALAITGGYVIALARARAALPAVPPLIAPGFLARAAIGGAAAAVLWALLSAATRRGGDRALATLVAATGAAIAASLALASGPAAGALAALPFVLATLLVLVVLGLESLQPPFTPLAVVAAFAVALVLGGLRFKLGLPRQSWGDRAAGLVDNAREHAATPHDRDTPEAAAYRAAFAAIPAGARVGVWVDRADLIDYRRHDVVDLRSEAAAACRDPRRRPRTSHPPALAHPAYATVPAQPSPLAVSIARPGAALCRRLAALPAQLALDALVLSPSAPIAPDDPVRVLADRGRPLATGDLDVVDLTVPP